MLASTVPSPDYTDKPQLYLGRSGRLDGKAATSMLLLAPHCACTCRACRNVTPEKQRAVAEHEQLSRVVL